MRSHVLGVGIRHMGITLYVMIYLPSRKRGNMGPVLEASGVLNTLGVEDRGGASHGCSGGRERPADVLLCRAQDVHTGNGQRGN